MKERFFQFQQDFCDLDLEDYTIEQLRDWLQLWNNYVTFGGVRPGKPH